MTDGVLFSVAGLLIETLGSAAIKEIALLWGVGHEFDKIQTNLRVIRGLIRDAENKRALSNQVSLWLERLEDVVSEADDLLDEVATEALLARRRNGLAKKACAFFSSSNQLLFRHKMAHGIKRIQEALNQVELDGSSYHLEEYREETRLRGRVRVRESHSFSAEEDTVGRAGDKIALVELLLSPLGTALSVIPVVGMGGLGKTTLAQLVYNDEKVRQHFHLKRWVYVSDHFDEKLLLEKIVESVTGTRAKNCTKEQLQSTLRGKINGKRYLLVLDDVWNESHEEWQDLKRLLSDCSEESRILVTTRSATVAKITGTVKPYKLGTLDREKSWTLLKKVALKGVNDEPKGHEFARVAEEILKKCGGVPLAINFFGSMLYFRSQEVGNWRFFQRELPNISSLQGNNVLETLKLSYDYLPSHLKHCFAFCSLFPKGEDIDVRTLILLWIAQGFDKSPSPSESLEDIGYEYFLELFWRCFFQDVQRDEISNSLTKCKMHDLVHDLAVHVAGEQYASSRLSEDRIHKKVRHVSLSSHEVPRSFLGAKRLRTLIFLPCLNWNTEEISGKAICEVTFSNFKFLRMLDLSDLELETVPSSISKLKHLRYLDLSRNYGLVKLPTSITKLVNLQTLKLNGCSKFRELPMDIENLVSLRHLEFDVVSHMPRGLSQLTNLQTLSSFVLSENSPCIGSLDELQRLNKLRGKLEIKGLRSGTVTNTANLKEKEDLQSLHLAWFPSVDCDHTNHDSDESLNGVEPHRNLAELSILWYDGVRIASWLSSLTNLVKLQLGLCYKCEIFPSLDQLCLLKNFKIYGCHSLKYIATNIETHGHPPTSKPISIFPSLQELEVSSLESFEGWYYMPEMTENQDPPANQETIISQLYLPSLTKLEVWDCPNLALMPLYPQVKELNLRHLNEKPFEQTALMSTSSSKPFSPLSHVKRLKIHISSEKGLRRFPKWMKGLSSLESLYIYWHPKHENYSRFEFCGSDIVWNNDCCDSEKSDGDWPGWECFTRLTDLYCEGLPNFKCLSPAIRCFTSLQTLQIEDCPELEIADEDGTTNCPFNSQTCLRSVAFVRVTELPSWLRSVVKLEELAFWYCDKLDVIPDWIGELDSLKQLQIVDCPMLASLPGSIASIRSLCSLTIGACPTLSKRCRNPTGQDWPKIKHIAEVSLGHDDSNSE